MAFSDIQIRKLGRAVERRHIKERHVDDKTLHYLEGWHVVSEANRIFGFDAWDRETVSSQCIWQKQVGYRFSAAYLIRVRISVRAGTTIVVREGLGSGEAASPTVGQAHERASKAAETDATKRALCTFGNPFGLSLYSCKADAKRTKGGSKIGKIVQVSGNDGAKHRPEATFATRDLAPDTAEDICAANGFSAGANDDHKMQSIDKSALPLGEPKRQRDKEHLRFVASCACVVCGQAPSHAHHVRIAQPRALGRKVSDEFTVPLCAMHHRELHARGDERAWWHDQKIDPLQIAQRLWVSSQDSTFRNHTPKRASSSWVS